MTSHGQRFRRRALRRGYKVDEVDTFLDRVEGTIAGEPLEAPVTAQEVHDVVFRVRFGGYDEWQVDLHLDRVERQLAEFAERGPAGPMAGPGGYGGPGGPPGGPSLGQAFPRGPEPHGGPPGSGPLPQRPTPAASGHEEYDEAPYGYEGERYRADMTTEMHVADHGAPPAPEAPRGPAPHRPGAPPPHGPGAPPPHGPAGPPPHGPGAPPPHGPAGPPPGGPAGPPPGGMGGPPPGGMGGPPPGVPAGPGVGGAGPSDLQRVDQLRRSFQPRRFGSGYDRHQVDQLFEEVIAAMSGRGPMTVGEAQLDPRRFDLVAGGYFEAEVDHALDEVREILRRG